MIRGMAEELSLVCNGSTIESRLIKLEVGHKTDRQFAFGMYTVFGGVLLLMPGGVHIATINANKQKDDTLAMIEGVRSRLAELEKARPKAGPKASEEEMIEVIKAKFVELENAISEKESGATASETKALVEDLKIKFSILENSILAQKSQLEPAPCDKN